MSFKKAIKWWTIILTILVVVQIVTSKWIAMEKLEQELLTEPFNPYTYAQSPFDSAFVRDFYVTDCASGTAIFYSHKLANKERNIKGKLGVKFIEFQDEGENVWTPAAERRYKLVYHTWAYKENTLRPVGLFTATQIEEMIINGKDSHKKLTVYRWYLFFWIKSFEQIESIYEV